MKVSAISEINSKIKTDTEKFILNSEKAYSRQIEKCAKKISEHKDVKPLVFLSGPSGSGKTTSAHRISDILKTEYNTDSVVISMDNYFRANSSENMPRLENGEIDLESPYCVNILLFREHMKYMNECREVAMPVFNFKKQAPDGSIPFCRKPEQVIIVEGIHALNPEVTGESIHDFSTNIYVSVRTRLENSEREYLHPSKIRLLRRLIRDTKFRGREIPDVFDYFESVSRGEELYIMPFKNRADIDIDTFHEYETSVYKGLIYDNLLKLGDTMNSNRNYNVIVKFLKELETVGTELVTENSMIKEFIGD